MFNTTNIVPFPPYRREWCKYRRQYLDSVPFIGNPKCACKNSKPITENLGFGPRPNPTGFGCAKTENLTVDNDLVQPRAPCHGQGFWSLAHPFYPKPASLDYNTQLGTQIAPGWSPEYEEAWLSSPAGQTSELLREYGYPRISNGRMQPLIYYNNF